MSRLELFGRPFVAFNPADAEHRKHYHTFVVRGSWGTCPVRFLCPDDHGDLLTMMQRSLVSYYVKQEFTVANKPQKTFVQKIKQMVDKKPV